MACSLSMSQRWARPGKDTTTLVLFTGMLVFFLQVVLISEAFPVPPVSITVRLGGISRFRPCKNNFSGSIQSVTWGKGLVPTDESFLLERNHDQDDMDENQHLSVDEDYRLIIKNTTREDSGPYWCRVIPEGQKSYDCSFNLNVTISSVTIPSVIMEPTSTSTMLISNTMRKANPGASTSKAAPVVSLSNVSMFLSLVSGLLTVWLTNVAGVG